MSETSTAFMAIQFKGFTDSTQGWLPTGANLDDQGLPISENASVAPPDRTSYAPIRMYRSKLEREYEGSLSSQGPRTVVRAAHRNLEIEKISDAVSGQLLEFLCTGKQLAWVHVVRLDENGDPQLKISIEDSQVIEYEFEATRLMGEERESGEMWSPYTYKKLRLDRMTLLYLIVKFTIYDPQEGTSIERDWDTGTDSAD